jgi:hypothetical protein
MRDAFAPRKFYQPISRAFRFQLNNSRAQISGQGKVLF